MAVCFSLYCNQGLVCQNLAYEPNKITIELKPSKNVFPVLCEASHKTGKMFLGCALGNAACRNGFKVLFKRVPRLLTDLAIAKGDGSYNRPMRELKNIKLLILDDWGLNVIDHTEGRDLLEVIEDRTQINSTVILSQLSTEDWHSLFADPIVGDAVLDRLIHGSYQIRLESKESMRSFNFQRT